MGYIGCDYIDRRLHGATASPGVLYDAAILSEALCIRDVCVR